ncbi:von Willebrand factor A domain-containing protein 7 [Stylophora pistillata]|uniref:von Willebrand factor A domain-containing protein 7 n=1 Tax=Stylophora pistillata TaxID=50429 RepID=A0A2B4RY27_STYPI|nr:von Willebrand factor A domain-containing protein 7 [Stylophora pistillata]
MGFSHGSERKVEILTAKRTKKIISPFEQWREIIKNLGMNKGPRDPKKLVTVPTFPKKAITREEISYEKESKTYRPRISPSNRFLEAINDIERAVAKAKASGFRYRKGSFNKLKGLLARAIRGKSYKYAREVLGRIMYLLSTKSSALRRRKRSTSGNKTTPAMRGSNFLQDLRKQIGALTFDSFMAVQGDVSLMFAIDDTGSMREEIQAAKNIAIDIINYPRNASVKSYILSPFNDPYPVKSAVIKKNESNAGEFVKAINALTAYGGGDCPEYTFTGMLEALYHQPEWGSPMYVFTDAGPKDASEENIEELRYLAGSDAFGVTINFLTTGFCHTHIHSAFKDLAELTSGQTISFKKDGELEKLSNLTASVLGGTSTVSSGSSVRHKKKRSLKDTTPSRYNFPVDESIEKLTVTVSTTRRETNVPSLLGDWQGITLTDPDDIEISAEKLSLSQISIYQIDHPKRGGWTLAVSGDHEFQVKSSSETNVDFEVYFIIPIRGRRRQTTEVPISNPVIGKLNKMLITVAGSEKLNTSSLHLELITPEGARISDVTLQTTDKVHFTASFTPLTSQPFKLRLSGITRGGNTFERISRQKIKPSSTLLRVKHASNDYTLPLGRVTFVHFEICNFGATEYFDVTVVKDRMGLIITQRISPKHVIQGHCAIISVRARATRPQDVDKTDNVFLIAKGRSSKVLASQGVRLFIVP